MKSDFGSWLAPSIAAVGLVGFATTFAVELGSFRSAVIGWAERDLTARTALAAATLRSTLASGDFRQLHAFGEKCRNEGVHLTVFSAPGGVLFDSRPVGTSEPESIYATAPSGDFRIRLGLPRERVLAPFTRARFGFLLAALVGGAGMLLVFFVTYRTRVRLRELARLEKFRREFVADLSHELKTPLTGIIGAVDLLGEAREPAMRDQLVAMIRRESVRLNALAQEILSLARLEREGDVLEIGDFDLNDVVRETLTSLKPKAETAGIALSGVDNKAPTLTIGADARLISEALSNLVENAIRHAEATEIAVTTGLVGNCAVIAVEDNGKGIPNEHAQRIFERFHRVDPARAAETGGAGLGLAIVQRIALLHGGEVRLETVHPHGARFVLRLPIRSRHNTRVSRPFAELPTKSASN